MGRPSDMPAVLSSEKCSIGIQRGCHHALSGRLLPSPCSRLQSSRGALHSTRASCPCPHHDHDPCSEMTYQIRQPY